MSPDLQEWLALAVVFTVAAIALWRRVVRKKANGCHDCSANQCRPIGSIRKPDGDPFRPQLSRPTD